MKHRRAEERKRPRAPRDARSARRATTDQASGTSDLEALLALAGLSRPTDSCEALAVEASRLALVGLRDPAPRLLSPSRTEPGIGQRMLATHLGRVLESEAAPIVRNCAAVEILALYGLGFDALTLQPCLERASRDGQLPAGPVAAKVLAGLVVDVADLDVALRAGACTDGASIVFASLDCATGEQFQWTAPRPVRREILTLRLREGDVLEVAGRSLALSESWYDFMRSLLINHQLRQPLDLGDGRIKANRKTCLSRLRRLQVKQDFREALEGLPVPLLDPEAPRLNPGATWIVEFD